MKYNFYAKITTKVHPIDSKYSKIKDQYHLYKLLLNCWNIETCTPRCRNEFSNTNKTAGQCSITSFLVQDIFGGEVYGITTPSGGTHCFNVVNGVLFDLTSEQFGDTKLTYTLDNPQDRKKHFSNPDKYHRYLLLKEMLDKLTK